MSDAQVATTADGAILYDASACAGACPDAAWFDPSYWASLGRAEVRAGGRGGVAFVETPAGSCVLRHYHRGGVPARISRDRYLWTGAARTRGFREFELLDRLVALGLPAPAPIAARYVRRGLHYGADLIVRRIANAETLAERLARGALDGRIAHAVGETLAQFHSAGAEHADLNAHNIMIDGSERVWLIDFDRGRLRKPALAWQEASLARLRRSFGKLGARARIAGFDNVFWHPMLAAYHAALSSGQAADAARGALR